MNLFKSTALRNTLGALVLALSLSPSARASFVVNVVQSGSNVVATGSGTLNTTALANSGAASASANVWPSSGVITLGSSGPVTYFSGITGPATFGSGPQVIASAGTGNVVAVIGNIGGPGIYVPSGYVSNSALSGAGTWNSQTIAGLGLTAGTYAYTWGSGATADSFVLNIGGSAGPSPTPAPSTLLLAILGVLGLALVHLIRSRRTA